MVFRKFYIGSCNATAVITKENGNDKYLVVCFNPTGTERKRMYANTFTEARKMLKPTICKSFNELRDLSIGNVICYKEFIPYLTSEEAKMREKELKDRKKYVCYSLTDCMHIVNVKAING